MLTDGHRPLFEVAHSIEKELGLSDLHVHLAEFHLNPVSRAAPAVHPDRARVTPPRPPAGRRANLWGGTWNQSRQAPSSGRGIESSRRSAKAPWARCTGSRMWRRAKSSP